MDKAEATQKMKAIAEKMIGETDTAKKAELRREAMELIAETIKPEIAEMVRVIEDKPETTRGHYGDYMAILGNYKGLYREAVILALKNAGGNIQGIDDAINLLNPNSY